MQEYNKSLRIIEKREGKASRETVEVFREWKAGDGAAEGEHVVGGDGVLRRIGKLPFQNGNLVRHAVQKRHDKVDARPQHRPQTAKPLDQGGDYEMYNGSKADEFGCLVSVFWDFVADKGKYEDFYDMYDNFEEIGRSHV